MKNLFNSSLKYVCIYSSNFYKAGAKHVKHRKFTDWIYMHVSNNWQLIEYIPNKYSLKSNSSGFKSDADFYFYEKKK